MNTSQLEIRVYMEIYYQKDYIFKILRFKYDVHKISLIYGNNYVIHKRNINVFFNLLLDFDLIVQYY
jgi:hypothetical protein